MPDYRLTLPLSDIKIGSRFRKDMGDVASLAESISAVGLLHPIVVTEGKRLVAGLRRIAAAKVLGWDGIAATVVKSLDEAAKKIRAERDENTCRKEFTPEEAVNAAEAIEPLERKAAEARQAEGQKAGGRGRKKLGAESAPSKGKARDKIAAAVGVGRDKLAKERAVVAAARADPKLRPLVDEMNRTGKVDRAHRSLKKHRREEARRLAAKSLPAPGKGILIGDFRKLGDKIAAGSLSLIFTDPPYDRESSKMLPALGEFAAAKLADGGSLLCYVGQTMLPAALDALRTHLRYWWTIACVHAGRATVMREYGVNARWKPVLWFVKGTRHDDQAMVDDVMSGGEEKAEHPWQQAESEAAYWIGKLCPKDGIVCDPFLGSGTTAVAAKRLKRQWVGIEVDEATAKLAGKRVAEA